MLPRNSFLVLVIAIFPGFLLAQICTENKYKKGKFQKKIKVCCKGYKQDTTISNQLKCNPICDNDCGQGDCFAPNDCGCYEGYENYENKKKNGCVPICSKGCGNGRCIAPENCECYFGFILDESTGKCGPFCSTGCPNGRCESPGICICNEGYRKTDDRNDQSCIPVCEEGCDEDRICSAPNKCSCHTDFIDIDNRCLYPSNETVISGGSTSSDCPVILTGLILLYIVLTLGCWRL